MIRRLRTLVLLAVALAIGVALAALPPPTRAQTSPCGESPETGHAICHGFLAFWREHGGVPVFGYPVSDEMTENGLVVQYFERARFEWHPGSAPVQHDVLLGRLGAELTAEWSALPPFQPTAPLDGARYFPETSHNLAEPFRSFWEESGGLQLFGYPLSEPYREHGRTVQYFERARFERSPGSTSGTTITLGLLGRELLAARTLEPLADGLRNPRGLVVAPDGSLYVAEAGNGGSAPCVPGPEGGEVCFGASGAVTRLHGRTSERIVDGLPSLAAPDGSMAIGPQDIAIGPDGSLYVLIGLGADPAVRERLDPSARRFGQLLRVQPNGTMTTVADLAAYEATHDPDGAGPDSNPYALLLDGDRFIVADAGANALLSVTMAGEITTLAVFPPFPSPAPPFLNLPPGTELPTQSVPTAIAKAPDGSYLVTELTGFPFPVGQSRLWHITPGQPPEVIATAFTNAIDLAVMPDGSILVLEITSQGILAAQQGLLGGNLGRWTPDGSYTPLIPVGLLTPTAFARLPDGSIAVTTDSVSGHAGRIVRYVP